MQEARLPTYASQPLSPERTQRIGGRFSFGSRDSRLSEHRMSIDTLLALQMQRQEVLQQSTGAGDVPYVELVDPMWGRIDIREGHCQRLQMCLVGCCPCCIAPVDWSQRRAAWRRFLTGPSFIIGTMQVLVMAYTCLRFGIVSFSENPMVGPAAEALVRVGARQTHLLVAQGQLYRLVTPWLLHAGLLHLLLNLLAQLRVGVYLEQEWGAALWCCVYVLAGLSATLLSCVVLPDAVSVGASGPLMGLLGTRLSQLMCSSADALGMSSDQKHSQLYTVLINVAIVLALSVVPLVDYGAHVGGLMAGIFIGLVAFGGHLQNMCLAVATRLLGLILLAAMFSALTVQVFGL